MENYQIADLLKDIARLMELHEENSFKIKSYQNAAFKLDRLATHIYGLSAEELEKVDGIGKSLSSKLATYFTNGEIEDYNKLIQQTPQGVLEIMNVKGIGPKKTSIIWKEMGIESLGELLYACNENRLIEVKGFGAKTQQQIKEAVQYKLASKGYFHYATAEHLAHALFQKLNKSIGSSWNYCGEFRRKCETLQCINVIIKNSFTDEFKNFYSSNKELTVLKSDDSKIELNTSIGLPIVIKIVADNDFVYEVWKETGNEKHLAFCLENKSDLHLTACASEEEIYNTLSLP